MDESGSRRSAPALIGIFTRRISVMAINLNRNRDSMNHQLAEYFSPGV
jgi:hypothetical protein